MTRLIFLDFDGVLNRVSPDNYLMEHGVSGILPRKVQLVKALAESTGAQIVLSTAWRELHSMDWLRDLLRRAGGLDPDLVIGRTPYIRFGTRGEEIAAYLATVDGPVQFVVLDDNDFGMFDMGPVRDWLIRTNASDGLTPKDISEAEGLLLLGRPWEACAV